MKSIAFLSYAWGTTIVYMLFIFWLATIPSLANELGESSEFVKIIYRFIIYTFLFLLIYRSIIFTLKSTVDRLAFWRSKREMIEDSEFVLVIETLVVILAMSLCSIVAFVDEFLQFYTEDRKVELTDVLISFMAITLSALVIYTSPILGEIELVFKNRIKNLFKRN